MFVNAENKIGDSFKAVDIKEVCGNVARSWWKLTEKKQKHLELLEKRLIFCAMEDKKFDCGEISIHSDLSDDQECILNLQKYLSQLDERSESDKKSGISVVNYLTEYDIFIVFAGVIDEDILSETTDEIKINDKEYENDDDDTGPSYSLLSLRKIFNL